MEELKWLTNTHDPNDPKGLQAFVGPWGEDDLRDRLAWLADKVIGEPKATAAYTAEQLKAMGMVGVYAKE